MADQDRTVETGAWYWINAAPPEEREQDLRNIKDLGYDYAVVCYGEDMTLIRNTAVEDTRRVLEMCHDCGLAAYVIVWSGNMMDPYLGDSNRHVDETGHTRHYYNLWNAEWRNGPYKKYLREVAAAYQDFPALRGYMFDDTFASYDRKPRSGGRYISYSPEDSARFRSWLKGKYKEISNLNRFLGSDHYLKPEPPQYSSWDEVEPPRSPDSHLWIEWYRARCQWYEDWARDTKEILTEVDPSRELYVLDGGRIAGIRQELRGIDFGLVAKHFDIVELYEMPFGFDQHEVDMEPILAAVDFVVSAAKQIASGKKVGADIHIHTRDRPEGCETWNYPDIDHIRSFTLQAFESGADLVGHYSYRCGHPRTIKQGNHPLYPFFPDDKDMLNHRQDLWDGMKDLNREIKNTRWPQRPA